MLQTKHHCTCGTRVAAAKNGRLWLTCSQKEREMRMPQKHTFEQRHKACRLDPLASGDLVWIPLNQTEGTVVTEVAPMSYQVTTPSGVLRRKRQQLRLLPPSPNSTRKDDTTHQKDARAPEPQHPPAADSLY